MSSIVQIQFAPWDKAYDFSFSSEVLKVGDYVVVETELGSEVGRVLSFKQTDNSGREVKAISRKADKADLDKLATPDRIKEVILLSRELVENYKLPMKIVDCYISWSGDKYNFAFIAEGRVDFRELVRDLALRLKGNIRLTQIGSRDEAKLCGGCGPCSRELCCRGVLKGFCPITTEMADAQQISHRGSDRISGLCGRLKCCLSYEYEGYKELDKKLPPLSSSFNKNGVKGTVVGHHILKQSVDVRVPSDRHDERDLTIEVKIK